MKTCDGVSRTGGATICFPFITIFKHRCLRYWSPWFPVLWIIVLTYRDWCSSGKSVGRAQRSTLATAPAQMSTLQLPLTLLNQNTVFQDLGNGVPSERDRREHSSDVFSLFLDSNLFLLYLGADLKERAKMDDAEVGHFVKRLRNLMDEIGKLSQLGNVS